MVAPAVALGLGSAASGIASGFFGNSAAEDAAKQQERARIEAERAAAFSGTLDDTQVFLPGGGGATFESGAKGKGQLFDTGAKTGKFNILVDAAGNLFTTRKGRSPKPMNRKATINPDGSISLPGSIGRVRGAPTGPLPGLAEASQNANPSASVSLGDLDPVRSGFVGSVAPALAAGSGIIDTQLDPGQFAPGGFGAAGGFAPGTSPAFSNLAAADAAATQAAGILPDPAALQAAQDFATATGQQLPPQVLASLQAAQSQGGQVAGAGAAQFAAGPNQFAQPQIEGFLNAADIARGEATQGFQNVAQARTDLLRQQAAPAQQRLIDQISQSAFLKGQLGTAGGREALRGAVEQIGQQDLGFQLAGQDLATQERAAAAQRATQFGGAATGFAGQGVAQQQAGIAGFGAGTGAAVDAAGQQFQQGFDINQVANARANEQFAREQALFGARAGISDTISSRAQERFGRAGATFDAFRGAQDLSFQQQLAQSEQFLNQLRANQAGAISERDAAFGRGVTGANAALALNQEARNLLQTPLAVSTAIGNQRLGAATNVNAANVAQISNPQTNNAFANAFGGLSQALGKAALGKI